jgi:hypothetical protein
MRQATGVRRLFMSLEERMVRVVGVDREAIKESPLTKGLFIIPFKLSIAPDETWGRTFYEIHRKIVDPKKKDIKLVGDRLEVHFSEADDQQQVLDKLKLEVESANMADQALMAQKLKVQEDMRALQQRQVDMMKKVKDDSDGLKF